MKTVFLYRAINQLLFIKTPKSYYNDCKSMVCKLNKVFYKPKQSPQLWYKCLLSFLLEKLSLIYININHNILITKQKLESLVLGTFVDDIKIIGLKNIKSIARVKIELIAIFEIVNTRLINFYLGLKVDKNDKKKTIKLS